MAHVLTWRSWSEKVTDLIRAGRDDKAIEMIDKVSMTEAPRLFVPPGDPPLGQEAEFFPPLCADSVLISAGASRSAKTTARALIDSYVAQIKISCIAVSFIPGEDGPPVLYNATIETLEKPTDGRLILASGMMYEIRTYAGAIVPTTGFVARVDGKREVVAMVTVARDIIGREPFATVEDLRAEGVAVEYDRRLIELAVDAERRVREWSF